MSRALHVVPLLAGLSLPGCASSVPSFDIPQDSNGPTVRSIVDRVTCELAGALAASEANRAILLRNDVAVVVQLSLTVNDTGGLAPTLSYIRSPKFMFNVGANLNQSREQNYTQKLYYSMRELAEEMKLLEGRRDLAICPKTDTNLAGELGLRRAIELAKTSSPHLNWDAPSSGTDGAFGGYVTFVVTKNLNMTGPTWALKHFKGPGGLGSLSEVNTDKITFAFARGKGAGSSSGKQQADLLVEQITLNQLSSQLSGVRNSME